MAGLWLYAIAEGGERTFNLVGEKTPVTINSYRELVENERLGEDRRWGISQHCKHVKVGDEVFIYTGAQNRGIIGYAIVKNVEQLNQGWCLELDFDFGKCRALLSCPIPAPLVRSWRLTLRPNLVDLSALASDLYSRVPWALATLPEEIINPAGLVEGAVCTIEINAYERNPDARRLCIEHHGTACSICGFDFGAKYGEAVEGLIHVHHLRTLSEIGRQYVVDPLMDLRPVCPNCHAVLHRRIPPYSLDEVRALLRAKKRA